MANKTVYPYGTEGTLPSSIGIINDLETGGVDKALSAEQGVVLNNQMKGYLPLDLWVFRRYSGALAATGKWGTTTSNSFIEIPVKAGDTYRITSNSSYAAEYAFFTEFGTYSSGGTAPLVDGTGRVDVSAGKSKVFTIPETCTFLLVNITMSSGSENHTPASIEQVVPEINTLYENDNSKSQDMEDMAARIDLLDGSPEMFDYETAVVSTTDSAKIAVSKDGKGGIRFLSYGTSGGRGYIHLPEGLEYGKTYRVSFRYFTQHNAQYWVLNVSNGADITHNGPGLVPNVNRKVSFTFPYEQGDLYLRLMASSVTSGSRAYIYDMSIREAHASLAEVASEGGGSGSGEMSMDVLLRQAQFVAESPTTQPLTLLHFSDIHNDTKAAGQIKAFYTKYQDKIDDMVQTGDVVQLYLESTATGFPWFGNYGIPEALFVIGNHDGSCNSTAHGWKEGNADWDFFGREWDFDTYFANYIETRGITPPVGYDDSESPYYKALYWHKDYASAKVRVIGIDGMHFNDGVRNTSNDQETWLTEKLQETLTSGNAAYGYSVIFLCHFPLDDYSGANETWDETTHKFIYNQNQDGGHVMDFKIGYRTNFHYGTSFTAEAKYSLRERIGEVGSKSYTKGTNNPIGDIIQTWVNNGGKYVVWLSGHTHTEYMYYPAKYPGLLVMGLPQAGNTRGTTFNDRSNDSPQHYCANLYVIDTQNTLFKVIRVANTIDKYLWSRQYLCYNYSTKQVFGMR